MNFSKRSTAGLLAAGMVLSSVGLGGCAKNYASPRNDSDALVVTIGDTKIYMDEVKPYILFEEVSGEYTAYFYKMLGMADDYWTSESSSDKDKTNEQATKDEIIETVVLNNILYDQAQKKGGYEVPADVKEAFEKNAKALMDVMTKKAVKKTGFTQDDFVKYQSKKYIADKYKDDLIASFGVKKEDFEKNYDYDKEYKAYETTYARVSLKDSNGNAVSNETKKELAKTMEAVKKAIDGGKSFEEAIEQYSDNGVTSSTKAFKIGDYNTLKEAEKTDDSKENEENSSKEDAKTDAESIADPEFIKTMYTNKVGNVTDVFEADGYYYVARVDDNNSKSLYDAAVDSDVKEEENKKFDEWKEDMLDGDYKQEINSKVWDTVELSDVAIVRDEIRKTLGVLEDPAKKNK